jgi:two-component system sensor histidine kinase YesM
MIKIVALAAFVLLSSNSVMAILYYNYAYRDQLRNYHDNARSINYQINAYLAGHIESLALRIYAIGNNFTLYNALNVYLYDPSSFNMVKIQGIMKDIISDINLGDRYLHSVAVFTPYGLFDSYTQIRRRDFVFTESPLYRYFEENPGSTIAWFPAMENPVFRSGEAVIPVVFLLYIDRKPLYITACLRQGEIKNYLTNAYTSVDKIFIIDRNGENILNYTEDDREVVLSFSSQELESGNSLSKEIVYKDKPYFVSCTRMPVSGWGIYTVKSAYSFFEYLKTLRRFILVVLALSAVAGILLAALFSHSITRPLFRLVSIMDKTPDSGFGVEFDWPYNDEIGILARSFNYMVSKIDQLVVELNIKIEALKVEEENVRREQQQKRMAELKALQAQINPHFLYNTLNTISWYAADQDAREIAVISNALGKFFRIALSRGHEFISIREETAHVLSYLEIQSIRYKSKLDYSAEIPEEIAEYPIIKLVLQPLVENALYHGIKPKEGKGCIRITGQEQADGRGERIILCVSDNGIGMETSKREMINDNLSRGIIPSDSGYGIYNVNERLRLYYGEAWGLRLEEDETGGVRALVSLPRKGPDVPIAGLPLRGV